MENAEKKRMGVSLLRAMAAVCALSVLSGCYVNVGGATSIGPNVRVGTNVGIDPATGEAVGGGVTTTVGFP